MPRIEIQDYRNWTITFNPDRELFHALSDHFDTELSGKSFSSVKKYIDDFIKDNQNFKPFKIEKLQHSTGLIEETLTVIGIRKDGRLVAEKNNGDKIQIGEYDEDRYTLPDSSNEPLRVLIKEQLSRKAEIEMEILRIKKQMVLIGLKEHAKKLRS